MRLAALLVAFLVLGHTLSKSLVVLHYVANRASITQAFCENKTKPQLRCNGQCHLAKQLKKQDTPSPGQSAGKRVAEEKQEYIAHDPAFAFHVPVSDAPAAQRCCAAVTKGVATEVFHPPA